MFKNVHFFLELGLQTLLRIRIESQSISQLKKRKIVRKLKLLYRLKLRVVTLKRTQNILLNKPNKKTISFFYTRKTEVKLHLKQRQNQVLNNEF